MTYTGDIAIVIDANGEWDIEYINGQPTMTDGLETCLLLAIFGNGNAQNGMTQNSSERYESTFPSVIERAVVSDTVRNDGTKAIERALAFMVSERMASKITVQGFILSAYAIGWTIDIEAPTGNVKYAVNWEKGKLTAGFINR